MKSYYLMWGKGFLLCCSHVSVAVNTTACLPQRRVPCCLGNASLVVGSGVCQAFYVHMGLLMRPKSRSWKLNPRRLSWRNLCFPALWSSSFVECPSVLRLAGCLRGVVKALPCPEEPSQDRAARLASAPGLRRAAHWPWLLRSVSWEVELRFCNCSNWGSRRSSHASDTAEMWLATPLPWCVDAVVRFSWKIVAWGLWQNRSCSSGSVLMNFVNWTQLHCVGGWSCKGFYRSPRYKTCIHCLLTSPAKPAGWCCQKRAQLAPSALCAFSPKW